MFLLLWFIVIVSSVSASDVFAVLERYELWVKMPPRSPGPDSGLQNSVLIFSMTSITRTGLVGRDK